MTLARKRPRLALAMTIGLAATACGGPAPVDPLDRISTGGIRYEVPARTPAGGPTPSGSDIKGATDLLQGVTGNGFKWSTATLSLEVVDGEVTFNGKKYGAVKEGDTVRVTREGALFINGVERKPIGA